MTIYSALGHVPEGQELLNILLCAGHKAEHTAHEGLTV